jgi:hypothetical protein
VKSKHGKYFAGFTPAVSDEAAKGMRREIRTWRLHRRSDTSLSGLAERVNPVVQGWINY